jgi:hypothetical protein
VGLFSAIIAEEHNKVLDEWKKRFAECQTIEDFKNVLLEFKNFEFSEE